MANDVEIKLKLSADEFKKALKDAGLDAEKAFTGATSAASNFATQMIALTASFVGFQQLSQIAKDIINTGAAFETLNARLVSVLGSTESAESAFNKIKALAVSTPFEVTALTDAFIKLTTFGLEPTDKQMLDITNTAAALGGGTASLESITRALGQAWAKGKLQGDEILQMAEAGVPVWDALANSTGKSVPELQKMSEAGKLGRTEIRGLIDELGKLNSSASSLQMATFSGTISNAKDALAEFYDLIAKSGILDQLKNEINAVLTEFARMKNSGELKDLAQEISNSMTTAVNAVKALVEILIALAPAIKLAVEAFVAAKIIAFGNAFYDMAKAATVGAATTVTATGTVAAGVGTMTTAMGIAEAAGKAMWRALGVGIGIAVLESIGSFVSSLLDSKAQLEGAEAASRKADKALEELRTRVPTVAKALDDAGVSFQGYVLKISEQGAALEELKKKNDDLLVAINRRHAEESIATAIGKAAAETYGTQKDKLDANVESSSALLSKNTELRESLQKSTNEQANYVVALIKNAQAQNDNSEATQKVISDNEEYLQKLNDTLVKSREAEGVTKAQAAAAKLLADTYGDQSKNLDSIKIAYDTAKAALEQLTEAQKQGRATSDQVKVATQDLGIATKKYADSLQDAVANQDLLIKSMQNQNALTQTYNNIALDAIGWEIKIAEAKGDTATATELKTKQSQLEIDQVGEQSNAEVDLAKQFFDKARNLEEIAKVSGDVSTATKSAIAEAYSQGEAHEALAIKFKTTENGMRELTKAQEEAKNAIKSAIPEWGALGEMVASVMNKASSELFALSKASSDLFDQVKRKGLDIKIVASLGVDAMGSLGDSLGKIPSESEGFQKAIADSTAKLAELRKETVSLNLGGVGALMNNLAAAAEQVKITFNEQALAASKLTTSLNSTDISLGNIDKAQKAVDSATIKSKNSFKLLDDEDLTNLKSAIDSAKNKIQQLKDKADAARSAIRGIRDSAQDALLRAQGNEKALLEREKTRQIAAVDAQLAFTTRTSDDIATAAAAKKAIEDKYALDLAMLTTEELQKQIDGNDEIKLSQQEINKVLETQLAIKKEGLISDAAQRQKIIDDATNAALAGDKTLSLMGQNQIEAIKTNTRIEFTLPGQDTSTFYGSESEVVKLKSILQSLAASGATVSYKQ